jgi:hypothetical protein
VSFTLLLALSHLTRYALSTSATSQRPMSLLDQLRKMLRNMLEPLAGFKVGPILFVLEVSLRTLYFDYATALTLIFVTSNVFLGAASWRCLFL